MADATVKEYCGPSSCVAPGTSEITNTQRPGTRYTGIYSICARTLLQQSKLRRTWPEICCNSGGLALEVFHEARDSRKSDDGGACGSLSGSYGGISGITAAIKAILEHPANSTIVKTVVHSLQPNLEYFNRGSSDSNKLVYHAWTQEIVLDIVNVYPSDRIVRNVLEAMYNVANVRNIFIETTSRGLQMRVSMCVCVCVCGWCMQ